MEISILLKSSSSPEPRTVNVVQDEAGLSFFCDCPAGERGRLCKHKKAVASGDASMLYDDTQRDNFNRIMEWVSESGYPQLMQELSKAENQHDLEKEKLNALKAKVIQAMNEGMK